MEKDLQQKEVLMDAEIKESVFDILSYFDKVCRENGLPYSLAFGTMLGAVRHKGFIPWDDDVDVCLLREDYEKLLEILKNSPDERFKVIDSKTNNTYFYNFAKIVDTRTSLIEKKYKKIDGYGVYVDIFPLDNCPNDEKAFNKLCKKIKFNIAMKTISVTKGLGEGNSLKKKIAVLVLSPIAKLFGHKYWNKKTDKWTKFYNEEQTEKVCVFSEYPKFKELISRDEFISLKEIEFNGKNFLGFSNPEKYLENRYGDFMQLPKEEDRVSHHGFIAYKKG